MEYSNLAFNLALIIGYLGLLEFVAVFYKIFKEKQLIRNRLGRLPILLVSFFGVILFAVGFRLFVVTCRAMYLCSEDAFTTETGLANSIAFFLLGLLAVLWFYGSDITFKDKED